MSHAFCSSCHNNIDDPQKRFCGDCGAEQPSLGWGEDPLVGRSAAQGQFVVRRRLGAGGFGTVYEVETALGQLVRAMKVLGQQWMARREVLERFIEEAVILDSLNHDHIARCYAVGRLDDTGQPYILMEYVQGPNLTRLVEPPGEAAPSPMAPMQVARLGRQIAAALEAAHTVNLLHRDLKPDNVLLTTGPDGQSQVKVIDFGIAKILDANTGETKTRSLRGTPVYMAPEQYMPGTPLGPRLDLWQLGAILHYALTGYPPYQLPPGGAGPLGIYLQQRARSEGPGPAPSAIREALKDWPALDDLVSRMLATDPALRPSSAREVREALTAIDRSQSGQNTLTPRHLDLLCQHPSDESWGALTRYVLSSGVPENQGAAASQADQRLGRWPDDLRRAPAAQAHALCQGQTTPTWPMARALDLTHCGLDDVGAIAIADNPALRHITRLDLSHNLIGDEGAAALAASPHLAQVTHLNLGFNRFGARGVRALAHAPHLRQLIELDLSGIAVGVSGVEALGSALLLAGLTTLSLNRCRLGPGTLKILTATPHLASLRRLELDSNPLGASGLAALLNNPSFARLKALSVANTRLTAESLSALAHQGLGHLHTLRLSSNALTSDAAWPLASSPHLSGLIDLDLDGNNLGVEGALALATSRWLTRLERLELSNNDLRDAGAAALSAAPCLSGLKRLGLAGNNLSHQSLRALAATPQLARLEDLDLSRNPVGDVGLETLIGARHLAPSHLSLAGCGLTPASPHTMRSAPWLSRLTDLDLSRNPMGPEGAQAITAIARLGHLNKLALHSTHLGAGGISALLTAPLRLCELGLSSNQIGDLGARTIADSKHLGELSTLDLRRNGIGPEGTHALARTAHLDRLTHLKLAHNPLGGTGAHALSNAPIFAPLIGLDIENCAIPTEALDRLRTSTHLAGLMSLNLRHNAPSDHQSAEALTRIREDKLTLIQESFSRLSSQGPELVASFYDELFARHPTAREMFTGADIGRQRQHMLQALVLVMRQLRTPQKLEAVLIDLGVRHQRYGVLPGHFEAVVDTMLDVLQDYSGPSWSPALHDAWHEGLSALCATMLSAYR